MVMLTSTFNKGNKLTYLPKSDTLQVEFLIKHSGWFVSQLCTYQITSCHVIWSEFMREIESFLRYLRKRFNSES